MHVGSQAEGMQQQPCKELHAQPAHEVAGGKSALGGGLFEGLDLRPRT